MLYYVHTDHLHRQLRMTNTAKSIVWSAEYQPWGAVQSLSGALTLDLRFPGQWFQLEAGLHYNWHRHYDPSLGRYTQADPLGFVDGPSVYGYAGATPIVLVDPSGRFIIFGGGGAHYTMGAGYDISAGAGIDLTTGQTNAFFTQGPSAGIGGSADIGGGIFFGDWCQFQGDSFSATADLFFFSVTLFSPKTKRRTWRDLAFGIYVGAGFSFPAGGTASPQQSTRLYSEPRCGCSK